MSVRYELIYGSASLSMVVLSGTTSCRPSKVWIYINSVRSSRQKSLYNSIACSTLIEVRICEVMVFISGGAPIFLGTCPETTITLPVFWGPFVYMAEFWMAETCSMWSVNYFSFANRVVFLLLKVRDGSSRWLVIVGKVGYLD